MSTPEIDVRVEPRYLPEESDPLQETYGFAYTITLSNHGEAPAQLISRHWIIVDADGHRGRAGVADGVGDHLPHGRGQVLVDAIGRGDVRIGQLHRRPVQGHARRLVQHAERLLTVRGCPKLNLQVRAGNEAVIALYESLGYADDQSVTLGKRLIADI